MRRCCLLLFLLCLTLGPRAAEPGEAEAFSAAAKAFQDGFHERAEKGWADFLARFPKSEQAPEAALMQAQACHRLKKFSAALEILKQRAAQAGPLADQFLFWRGQALLDEGDLAGAAGTFAEFLGAHPASALRLNAAVNQALASFRRDDFGAVIETLGAAAGPFQQAVATSTNLPLAARGFLLLGEAQLRRNETGPARATLIELAKRTPPPELEWERWQLLARIEMARGAPGEVLPALSNALALATSIKRPEYQAETLHAEAEVLNKLGQLPQAEAAYERILALEGMPQEQKRLALQRVIELGVTGGRLTNAVQRITAYLAANPQDGALDALHLRAGELLIEEFRRQPARSAAPATNLIAQARAHFDLVIQQWTNSPWQGRAWADRGWALWEEHQAGGAPQQLAESQAAFQAASAKLPPSEERARIVFKLGDIQFAQGLFAPASTNYAAVIDLFLQVPNVSSNLAARASEQLVRSHLAVTNMEAAEAALQKGSVLFPSSPQLEESWLAMGQACAEAGLLDRARSVLKAFSEKFPRSKLLAQAELAYAGTFAAEGKWAEAISLHAKWAEAHPADAARPQAAFERAWLHFQAGDPTNAFQLFTNYVAQFPAHPLAARAQNWIADHYYGGEQWNLAEQSYQRVFQNTNWPATDLAFQARMMAARTAFFRQGYADARSYLTNLIFDAACPPDVAAEAWFVLGDVLIEQRSTSATNALNNFSEALIAFDRVTKLYPTNRLEPLAWGKIGDCHFQLASVFPESYEKATNAYFRVLESKQPQVPVAARNQAEVGIALVMEKLAEVRPKSERPALLQQALQHHLNVVYGNGLAGARPDPFWQKRAGLAAGRLAEALGQVAAARGLYQRLAAELPSMRTTWEAKGQALPAGDGE